MTEPAFDAMNTLDRQRRHDERWQKEVLNGMARTLDVLHDISDHLQRLTELLGRERQPTPPGLPEEPEGVLLSVNRLAEYLGITPAAVRNLQVGGKGPSVTRVGSRVYFHRDDVAHWLARIRPEENAGRPWRGAYLPGRIGSTFPSSSERSKQAYCSGSHTEPRSASPYSGRAVCRACGDHVLVNNNGLLRKHYPRGW